MMDFTKIKKLTIGGITLKQLFINGIQVWKSFTNRVPESIDTDNSIFNGCGYKENVRLGSSGSISSSAQNGSVTTGFIKVDGANSVIRLKGVEWLNAFTKYGGHFYLSYYDSSKKLKSYVSSETYSGGTWNHVLTVTRDANGVETFAWNKDYGTTHAGLNNVRESTLMRITAKGKGADMIVTVNEEIT